MLFRSRVVPSVVLLEFSRDPQSFHRALLMCDELEPRRARLKDQGFPVHLPSGAKVFVEPEIYAATMEAVRIAAFDLKPRHVLVDAALEGVVERVVKSHVGKLEKVKHKGRTEVPLTFADAALNMNAEVVVSRTFIHIKLPSSLSSAATSGLVTASTTQARSSQNSRNPRAT